MEQKSKTEENRGTKAIWQTGNIENQDFYFGEQGKMPIFFSGKQGNRYPHTPGKAMLI